MSVDCLRPKGDCLAVGQPCSAVVCGDSDVCVIMYCVHICVYMNMFLSVHFCVP